MKILVVGQEGIEQLIRTSNCRSGSNVRRQRVVIHKDIKFEGVIAQRGNIIELGNEESIVCDTEISANAIFDTLIEIIYE